MKTYYILIPAYKPEPLMLPFLRELREANPNIVVVDDGSGAQFTGLFDQVKALGIPVLVHEINRGKGQALKTGISYIAAIGRVSTSSESSDYCAEDTAAAPCPAASDAKPTETTVSAYTVPADGIITADCDGQHTVADIIRVQQELDAHPQNVIIGGRELKEKVPLRSRLGNGVMRFIYRLVSRNKIHDTQTGLRGLPASVFPQLITLKGDRYEYEMNMLLELRHWGVPPREIVIDTIYINNNSGSHYNSFSDSLRIAGHILAFVIRSMFQIAKYGLSSFVSYLLEYAIFQLLSISGLFPVGQVVGINVIARICSALFNYIINKKIVFKQHKDRTSLIKYIGLVVVTMLVSSLLLQLLCLLFTGPDSSSHAVSSIIKPIIDAALFFLNYFIQRDFVFKNRSKEK